MGCLHTMAPSDDELLCHALDGVPLPMWAKEHLTWCKSCQQRLERYSQTNASLLALLYRRQCPGVTTLAHYCAGLLPADDMVGITTHIETCPLCSQEVAETRRFMDDVELFPVDVTTCSPRGAVQRFLASQVPGDIYTTGHDSPRQEQNCSWPRQYQSQELHLSLHLIYDKTDNTQLMGFMSSTRTDEHFAQITVELHRINEVTEAYGQTRPLWPDCTATTQDWQLTTHIDELGNLVFRDIPSGNYYLIVYLPEHELVIEGLDIRSPERT